MRKEMGMGIHNSSSERSTYDNTTRPDQPLRFREVVEIALLVRIDERKIEFRRRRYFLERVIRRAYNDFDFGG